MNAIQPWQMKTIYAVARSLGMDNEELHMLVAGMTGKESIKALDTEEADTVMVELKARQGHKNVGYKPKRRPAYVPQPGYITAAQRSKVWALMYALEKVSPSYGGATLGKRLCGIIENELTIHATPQDPTKWVKTGQAKKLIDALKRYVKEAEKKAAEGGRAAGG